MALLFGLYCAVAAIGQVSYSTSWLGNTFPGGLGGDAGGKWVQNFIENIYVLSDGRVITNSGWDEAGADAVMYQNGQIVNGFVGMHCCGGQAVTANSNSVFLSYSQGRQAGTHGVKRFSFSGSPLGSTVINNSQFITGLAASDTRLYVSDPASGSIVVLDSNSLASAGTFAFANPGKIALDRAGTLWIVDTATNKVRHFSTAGAFLGQEITNAGQPTALAIDNMGRLMVGDSGTRQQILFYDITSAPALAGTFGAPGGIYSGTPGQVADTKLISPTGVGTDSAGNIYVSSSLAGAELRALTPAGQKLWQLIGLEYVDVAVADPATDGADVYTKDEHMKMDYTKGPGQEATWAGMSIDRLSYPTDPRISFTASMSILAVRNVQGRKYLYMTDQYANFLAIYRLNGEIAVPAGFLMAKALYQNWLGGILPSGQAWMWRDSNGNGNIDAGEIFNVAGPDFGIWGWDVDNQGNVYAASEAAGIVKYAMQSIDGFGNPVYATPVSTPAPAPFTRLERIRYVQSSDTMYLSGFTTERPYQSVPQDFGLAGSEIVRYDNWSTGNRTPHVRIQIPYDPANTRYIKAFDVTGQRVFAGVLRSSSTENVYAYDSDTGAAVGQILPGPEINRNIGWIDGAENLKAFQRSTGEYLLFEEEVVWAKVIMFRIAGSSPQADRTPPSVSLTSPSAGTISGSVSIAANASDNVGVAGVQFVMDGANLGTEITAPPFTLTYNTTALANGPHTLSAVARDAAANKTTSAAVAVTVNNPSGGFNPIRVNGGGPAYTDAAGQTWRADFGYIGGAAYQTSNAIAGTTAQPLYQTERWDSAPFTYQFAVPNGGYTVRLKFAELYFTQPGQRVFNVALNGQTVLSKFDIVAKAGGGAKAIDQQFTVAVTNGSISIQFIPVVSNPKISAIEIVQTPTSVTMTPGSVQLSAGQSQAFTATVSGTSNTAVTWLVSGPGTISPAGVYTAPDSVTGSQFATVKAVSVADASKFATATVTLKGAAPAIRINAGGGGYTDPSGVAWGADSGFNGGGTYATTATISGTAAPVLYQSERWSDTSLQYQFAVANGSYTVKLRFAEIFFTQPGQRTFNVLINGQTVLANFDIVAQAGGANTAIDKQFAVNVTNGSVVVQFVPVISNAKISAIEVY